jgi:hypothetical protein
MVSQRAEELVGAFGCESIIDLLVFVEAKIELLLPLIRFLADVPDLIGKAEGYGGLGQPGVCKRDVVITSATGWPR